MQTKCSLVESHMPGSQCQSLTRPEDLCPTSVGASSYLVLHPTPLHLPSQTGFTPSPPQASQHMDIRRIAGTLWAAKLGGFLFVTY